MDNFALLHLDTIWCHLNLESLHALRDAEERLASCEQCLARCYGAGLERLALLKTECASKHTPIYVRLHLFKAILAYHRGRKAECKQQLDTASDKLRQAQVDEAKLAQVVAMGFGSVEARLALRAAANDVEAATDAIFRKKQRQRQAQQVELAQSLEKEFGRSASGRCLDQDMYAALRQRGFTRAQAARALLDAENDVGVALGLLELRQEGVERLVAMGYKRKEAARSLEAAGGDLAKAVEVMAIGGDEKAPQGAAAGEAEARAVRLYEEMAGEMAGDDEAYLDLELDQDARFIDKYYDLLRK